MHTTNTFTIKPHDTVIAIKFDRNDQSVSQLLKQNIAFQITRRGTNDNVQLSIEIPSDTLFSIIEYEGDLDELRSRTKTYWRTSKNVGESIFIGVDELPDNTESNYLFIVSLGGNKLAVFAEPHFKFRNDLQLPNNYKHSTTNLPDEITTEAERLLRLDTSTCYDKLSLNRLRKVTFELDDILNMVGTKAIYAKARQLKYDLEIKIKELKQLKTKNNLSKEFSHDYQSNLIKSLSDFIIANHGADTLNSITGTVLRETTDSFKNSPLDDVLERRESYEVELKKLQNEFNGNPLATTITNFMTQPNPPRFKISNCIKCHSKASISVIEPVGNKSKRHSISCTQCCNTVEAGRIGTEAILMWNQLNNSKIKISDYDILGIENLSDDAIRIKLKEANLLLTAKSREINLLQQINPTDNKSKYNKLRGMNRVLSLIIAHYRLILDKNTTS